MIKVSITILKTFALFTILNILITLKALKMVLYEPSTWIVSSRIIPTTASKTMMKSNIFYP